MSVEMTTAEMMSEVRNVGNLLNVNDRQEADVEWPFWLVTTNSVKA